MKKSWPSGRRRGWSIGASSTNVRRPLQPQPQAKPYAKVEIVGSELPADGLRVGERGALILPRVNVATALNGIKIGGTGSLYDESTLRIGLLLFDQLSHVTNNMIGMDTCPRGLEDWQGLRSSKALLQGPFTSELFTTGLLGAFKAHEEREPGLWALLRDADSPSFPSEALQPDAAFRMRLLNALCIPDKEVPFEDVLAFKARRNPELMSLRHHLEDIAIEVAKTGHKSLAETVAYEKFQKSLADYAAVCRQENFAKRLISLDVKIQWDKLADPKILAGLAAAGSFAIEAPILNAAWSAISAAAPVFALTTALGLKRKTTKGPFEYITLVGREL